MQKLNLYLRIIVLAVFTCSFSLTAQAEGSLDGSQNLLCAPQVAIECGPDGKCEQAMAASVNLPNFFQVDFSSKELTAISGSENKRTSTIKSMEFLDGKMFLQGTDDGIKGVRDGLAWSMSISQDTGRLVVSASGGNEAFVIFGACTPK
jgi:hypothetical protein